MDVFSNSGGVHAACVTLAYFRPYIFKFAFGISYEYQTIKLNDVLTPERFSFISNNSSFHVIYIRSVSSQLLLGHINTHIIKYRVYYH
jgi:hypothetical protein